MKKYKISVLLVIILCFTILPSYVTTSSTEAVVETNEVINDKALQKQKATWEEELFHILVKIESNELYDINNNVTTIREKIEDKFSFNPEYGDSYYQPGCVALWNQGISFMYATMRGACSWSGYQSGCLETGICGGGGTDCGEDGGPCEF